MKRNLTLLGLLALLLGGAYLFEERIFWRRRGAEELFPRKGGRDLIALRTSAAELRREGGRLRLSGGGPVDPAVLDEFFSILHAIRLSREIPPGHITKENRADFFPAEKERLTLQFPGRTLRVLLGKKLDFDQSFYLELEENGVIRHLVARDESPRPGVYHPATEHRSENSYRRLRSLFHLREEVFLDKRLFPEGVDFTRLVIRPAKGSPREVDWQAGRTRPAPPPGVKYLSRAFAQFPRRLANLRGKNGPAVKLTDKIADIDLGERSLQLFKRKGEFFLRDQKRVYKLSAAAAEVVSPSPEDFWDLRPVHPERWQSFAVRFPPKERWIRLRHRSAPRFRLEGENVRPNEEAFVKLLSLLSSQAESVSSEKFPPETQMKIDLGDAIFSLGRRAGKLWVRDESRKLNWRFSLRKGMIPGAEFSDYFL